MSASIERRALFDRLRAWAQAARERGAGAERDAELERELAEASDPALRLDDFRDVWEATDVELEPARASGLSCERVIAAATALERKRTASWKRVAAGFVLVAGAAAAVGWMNRDRRSTVEITSIAAVAPPNADEPAELPPARIEALATYLPVADGSIRWIASKDDAYAIAAAVGRPVFVFGLLEHCPFCERLQQREFKDPLVLEHAWRCVPLVANLAELPADELLKRMQFSYPVLELHDAGRQVLRVFESHDFEIDVAGELDRSLAALPSDVAPVPWRRVRELCSALVRAREAVDSAHLGAAERAFTEVAAARDAPAFAVLGARGLQGIESAARIAIESASAAARADDAAARRAFAGEVARFAGTRHERDLAALLDGWTTRGSFPKLRFAH